MLTSPSQIVNLLACDRKWWFRTCHKVADGKDPSSRDTGTVLHEVAGRWLNADDQGRDQQGQPVDLYPAGWECVREFGRDTGRRIDLHQQAIIRVMIQKGIENGTLRRLTGRQIERHLVIPLIPGVDMQGYVDQDAPLIVEDHKTTKNYDFAIKTKAKLAKDEKMLCYAVMKRGEHPGEPITLRLNYFDKSQARDPWPLDTCVKPESVVNFLNETLIPAAKRMLALHEAKLPLESWAEVAGPNKKGACEEYGGCPYARICSRVAPVRSTESKPEKPKEKRTMSYFKKRNKPTCEPTAQTAAKPESSAGPVPSPNDSTSSVAGAATSGQPTQAEPLKTSSPGESGSPSSVPPWTVASCRACNGKGLNSKGQPCRACDVVQGRTNGVTSSQFETWVDDAGMLRWKPAGGAKIVAEPKKPEPKTSFATNPKSPLPQPEKKEEAKPAAPPPPKDDRELFVPLPEAVGIPIVEGFDLFIGCTPLGRPVLELGALLFEEGKELAAELKKDSYYSVDAFQRRDALASRAQQIASRLNGFGVVTAIELTPDERNLLVALRPLAKTVTIRL